MNTDDRAGHLVVALAEAQYRDQYGSNAPDVATEERLRAQRALRCDQLKGFTSLRGVNFRSLAQRDPATFAGLSKAVLAEAEKAARDSGRMRGKLVEIESKDKFGRVTTEFYGDPNVWMAPFQGNQACFGRINHALCSGAAMSPGCLSASAAR